MERLAYFLASSSLLRKKWSVDAEKERDNLKVFLPEILRIFLIFKKYFNS